MFCRYCGKKLDNGVTECDACGCYVGYPPTNVFAILGFIFSILGGILGLAFSLCGLSRAQKMGGEGAMMAKIGFAVSLVVMCLEVILLGLVIAEIAEKAM